MENSPINIYMHLRLFRLISTWTIIELGLEVLLTFEYAKYGTLKLMYSLFFMTFKTDGSYYLYLWAVFANEEQLLTIKAWTPDLLSHSLHEKHTNSNTRLCCDHVYGRSIMFHAELKSAETSHVYCMNSTSEEVFGLCVQSQTERKDESSECLLPSSWTLMRII